MARRICLLEESVRDGIRSGYRVDSVCGCVQQLVWNSVEAGAQRVSVRVDHQFFHLTVIDDGHGISRRDLDLVGLRFASSKGGPDDSGEGWGGRGESLASIVSLSRSVHLETKPQDEDHTYLKTFECTGQTKVLAARGAAGLGAQGCSVSVRDFLFNLPVRRGGLEGAGALERVRGALEEVLLAHPHLLLSLYDVSRDAHLLTPQPHPFSHPMQAFAHLHGAQWKPHLRPISLRNRSLVIRGFLSTKPYRNTSLQLVFVGGRRVRMREASEHLSRRMCQHHHFRSEFPVFLLHFTCPLRSLTLSLEEGGRYSVEGLRGVTALLDTLFPSAPPQVEASLSTHHTLAGPDVRESQAVGRSRDHALFRSMPTSGGGEEERVRMALRSLHQGEEEEGMRGKEVRELLAPHLTLEEETGPSLQKRRREGAPEAMGPVHSVQVTKEDLKNLKSIGQVDFRFLTAVSQREDRKLLLILDQHAVHERILLEKYTKEHVVGVALEPPLRMRLEAKFRLLLLQNVSLFRNLGLHLVECEGAEGAEVGGWWEVRSVPLCFVHKGASRAKLNQPSPIAQLVKDTIDDVVEGLRGGTGSALLPNTINELLKSQACHGAVKFGDPLSPAHQASLLRELSLCQLPFQCAHGRPSLTPLLLL